MRRRFFPPLPRVVLRSFTAAAIALALVSGVAPAARGDVGPPAGAPGAPALDALLAGAARHAEQFEQMRRRGSFTLSGRIDELDGSGRVAKTRELVLRSTATPAERSSEVLRYAEDGVDKTAEARRDAEKRRLEKKKAKKASKSELRLPFHPAERARYRFSVSERDPQQRQTRVTFEPLEPSSDTFKGSAWIDEASGELLTLAVAPSKTPTFVNHLEITMRFDLRTPLGRAPSTIEADIRGGFLFLKKRYRGSAKITDPTVAF